MTASCPAESVCSQASPTEHTCVCNAGYAGSDCEDVDECDATPCAHTCSNFAGGLIIVYFFVRLLTLFKFTKGQRGNDKLLAIWFFL